MTAEQWQRLKGAMMGFAGLLIAWATPQSSGWASGWVWLMLIAPDVGMLGYLLGPRAGEFTYNALHLYGGGLFLASLGVVVGAPWLITLGALWMAHIGIDRALGYGLKHQTGFQDTHLGRIGRQGD